MQDGIADGGVDVTIAEGGSDGIHGFVVDDAVEQVGEFVDEGVFPANDVTGRPPIFQPRVLRLGDENVGKPLRSVGFAAHPEYV